MIPTSDAIIHNFYVKYSTNLITDEIKKKLYEVADKVAEEIIDKYELKEMIRHEMTSDQIMFTVIMQPKELKEK